jgi:FkbM family methyltransferase
VYAIEPIPTNVDLLKKNIELNTCKNILVYQCAIGDRDGTGKMYVFDKCNWCSFIKNPTGNVTNELEVPLMTLDRFVESYVRENPTFIRMDVEGYEYQIIKGASKVLEKDKPLKLCIELHPHLMPKDNMLELLHILKQNGLKVKAIFVESNSYEYKDINLLNKLRRKMELPEFGFGGESYEDLDKLMRVNRSCMAFFAK